MNQPPNMRATTYVEFQVVEASRQDDGFLIWISIDDGEAVGVAFGPDAVDAAEADQPNLNDAIETAIVDDFDNSDDQHHSAFNTVRERFFIYAQGCRDVLALCGSDE